MNGEMISDYQPTMCEIVTRCIPFSDDETFKRRYFEVNGEVIFQVQCEDGWFVVYQLPSAYWQGGCP
jgi:hypothetical protein